MSHPSHPVGPGAAPGPDPEAIAGLVEACPAVAGLHGGTFGEVASYLPGRRVRGVRIADRRVELHIVGRYPVPALDVAAQVRAAVGPLTGSLPVDVTIADLLLPGDPDPPRAILHDRPTGPAPMPESPAARAPAFPPPPGEPATAPGAPIAASAPADRLTRKESAR